jgi:hypothetical protein
MMMLLSWILDLVGQISTDRPERLQANDPLRAAADRIAGEIAAALDGGPLAAVVPLRIAVDPEGR